MTSRRAFLTDPHCRISKVCIKYPHWMPGRAAYDKITAVCAQHGIPCFLRFGPRPPFKLERAPA